MAKEGFTVNAQFIPWPQWWRVVGAIGGNKEFAKEAANFCFYRAHCAKAPDVVAWIMKGLIGENRYALKPCKAEESGAGPAREWIEANIIAHHRKPKMAPIKADLKAYLHKLAESL